MLLEVAEVRPVTDRVMLFTLIHADQGDLVAYTPGAHIEFDLGDTGTRSYSLVDFVPTVAVPGAYHIAVQIEPDRDGGSRAMHALKVGDKIEASAPKNSFELHDGDAPALLIAGGIGVTPIISFATALKARGTPFAFHYAARDNDVCAFRQELSDAFQDDLTLWMDDTNQIDVTEVISGAPQDAHIFCCGPKGMIEAVKSAAEKAGYAADRIRFELFETPDTQEGDQPFEVQINDGRSFTIPPGKSIIDVLEEAAVDVMYDCQRGDCGICQTDVLDGTPDHRDVVLSEDERNSGSVMQICVSRAKSAKLVLDI